MTRTRLTLFATAVAVAAGVAAARSAAACTNFIITRGAAADGSTMITYAADAHNLYGELYYTPAGRHAPGATREIIEWDTGKRLGRIPQVPVTYSVVGNMNEHQVSIGETTFGGRKEIEQSKGDIDYGTLMYVALERARTAREAIQVMTDLAVRHGYNSEGESFSVADPREAWILEMIGKGPTEKGVVWVARKIPDGYVAGHANQARIRQFPRNDPQNTLYAKDVVDFARKRGWFKGKDADFSFADTYAPLTWDALRACESRVWSMFRRVNADARRYFDWVNGNEKAPMLPLWIKPDRKIGVHDLMELMRDHFEGTPYDLSKGVGAGPYELPYRWRPMTYKVDGAKYINERATSTQQTGFSFVAQMRAWLPGPIGGVLWFGVDDTYSTVYVPMYCGIREAPKAFAVGTADFKTFSWESAFWVFNFVANYTYSRYRDMIRDVRQVQGELEAGFLARQPEVEETALKLYRQGPGLARDYLTEYSAKQSAAVLQRWRKLGEQLIVKYLDGNVRDESGKPTHPGYPEAWNRRIARDSGESCKVRRLANEPPEEAPKPAVAPAGAHGTPPVKAPSQQPQPQPPKPGQKPVAPGQPPRP
ncbi:MAG TPA: C69 family dipeptidase [Polyangia bacterium]|jgi:dipeptidase